MDFISPLPISRLGSKFILYILYYFYRFLITFALAKASISDIIKALLKVFIRYDKPKAFYLDRGQHFNNKELRTFLINEGIVYTYSPLRSSQSTSIVEVSNKLLEEVIRKGGDFKDNLV